MDGGKDVFSWKWTLMIHQRSLGCWPPDIHCLALPPSEAQPACLVSQSIPANWGRGHSAKRGDKNCTIHAPYMQPSTESLACLSQHENRLVADICQLSQLSRIITRNTLCRLHACHAKGHANMMQISLHASQDDHKSVWVPLRHLKPQPVVCVGFPDLVPDLAAARLPCGLLRSVSLKTGCTLTPSCQSQDTKAVQPCTQTNEKAIHSSMTLYV